MADGRQSASQARNPKTFLAISSFMIESANASFEMAKDGLPGVALGLGGKVVATATFTSDAADSKGGKAASFVGSEVMQTLNLLRLATDASPTRIIATLGATFVRKMATAFMYAGEENRQAELIGDWADVVGQALALSVSVPVAIASFGIETPLAVLNAGALAVACVKAWKATTQ
jgi:hypothetical protein